MPWQGSITTKGASEDKLKAVPFAYQVIHVLASLLALEGREVLLLHDCAGSIRPANSEAPRNRCIFCKFPIAVTNLLPNTGS